MRWHCQRSQVGSFLLCEGASRSRRVVGGHVSSPQVRYYSLLLMTGIPDDCNPCPYSLEAKNDYIACSTFTRNRSRWARPNIWRFKNLSRLTCPSVMPFLSGREKAAYTAASSRKMPLAK